MSASDDKEQGRCVLHGIDDASQNEIGTTTPSTTSRTSSSHSGGNARTSPHASPKEELVPTPWSQHPTPAKKSWRKFVILSNGCRRFLFPPKHARRGISSRVGHERPRNSSTPSSCRTHEGSCCPMDCTTSTGCCSELDIFVSN